MRRLVFFAFLAMAIAAPNLCLAQQDRFTGTLKVAFGWVLDPDGKKRSIKGLEVPFVAERIYAIKMKKAANGRLAPAPATPFENFMSASRSALPGGIAPRAPMAPTVYSADSGTYAILDPAEFDDPSSLDDLNMSAATGRKWETLTFGVDVPGNLDKRLFRFINYSTYNPSAPSGSSAFGGVFADWGFHAGAGYVLQFPNPGTWKVTIPVSVYNIVPPSNTCYMAQQMRLPNAQNNGEGPFATDYRNVYSTAAEPSVGSSTNGFWYDWAPQDGVFSEDEFDLVSLEPTIFSNHLRTVTAEETTGITETLVPFELTFPVGTSPTGTFTSLWTSNDQYATVKRGFVLNPSVHPMQFAVKGLANSANANSIKLKVELGTTTGGAPQRLYMYNFSTNQYDLVDTRTSTTSDSVVEVTINDNASRYINQVVGESHLQVRALVTFGTILTLNNSWNARVDQAVWIVNRP